MTPNDVAIDCGGNKAQHTFHIAKKCRRVYCFEAIPNLANRIAVRVEQARYQDRILVLPLAISNKPGVNDFTMVVGAEALSSFRPQESSFESKTMRVPTVALDDVIHEPISFIKLDIEGAEFQALKGARRILQTSRPILALEFSREHTGERFGYTADEFFSYFEGLNYEIGDIFGTKLKREFWSKSIHLPWYAIGWPKERSYDSMWQAIAAHSPILAE